MLSKLVRSVWRYEGFYEILNSLNLLEFLFIDEFGKFSIKTNKKFKKKEGKALTIYLDNYGSLNLSSCDLCVV